METNFKTANDVFNHYYTYINKYGVDFAGTKAVFNTGFTIQDPLSRDIHTEYRAFSRDYAEAEWQWYLSGDPSIEKLGEIYGSIPPIWETMADWNKEVRSNYGWQWNRNNQLDRVIHLLKSNHETRQAVISIYDGKEIKTYATDTPCTYAVSFTRRDDKLHMSVLMRSNDLWFGFCNDQYCFSKLQELVAKRLDIEVGEYYHHATNLHIYNRHLNKN